MPNDSTDILAKWFRLLFIILAFLLVFGGCSLCLLTSKAFGKEAQKIQIPPVQCLHYNCWTYITTNETYCDFEIENCDGRVGELVIRD